MIKEAMLYERLGGGRVRCGLCSHRCEVLLGKFGICGVRKNQDGKLCTLVYGEAIASHVDPIEKKPLYHFLPGSTSYSIAALGCNFKCSFCQNWEISQASKRGNTLSGYELMPETVIREAKKNNCKSIAYTYTEPTIFFEYAYDTARLAKEAGLYNVFVTNGYMTEEAIETIRPYLDACNVDLKSFREDFYKKTCSASLKPVLDSIRRMKGLDMWVEVTTLIIPGQNDSEKEFTEIAEFIAGLGIEIPWHISRFHPDFKYSGLMATPPETLQKAKAIGEETGLRYIYLGNVVEGNDTYCYNCKALLIKRTIFDVSEYNMKEGRCPSCGVFIDGLWN